MSEPPVCPADLLVDVPEWPDYRYRQVEGGIFAVTVLPETPQPLQIWAPFGLVGDETRRRHEILALIVAVVVDCDEWVRELRVVPHAVRLDRVNEGVGRSHRLLCQSATASRICVVGPPAERAMAAMDEFLLNLGVKK